MSWRTHGSYQGLGESEMEWLRNFNRGWDTRAEGRSRDDAFEHMRGDDQDSGNVRPKLQVSRLKDIPSPSRDELCVDAQLAQFMGTVARFTVPKVTHFGWSIHIVMRDGSRTRARFSDYEQAQQAHVALQELSLTMSVC